MRNILSIFFLLTAFILHGQNIRTETISWNVTTTFNATIGEQVEENSMIVSYADHIEWKTANGTVKDSFTILETNGSWTDIGSNGQIIFEVDKQGRRGTIQFTKAASGISIRFILIAKDAPEIYELTIANTQTF
jgi:hypothetical protein